MKTKKFNQNWRALILFSLASTLLLAIAACSGSEPEVIEREVIRTVEVEVEKEVVKEVEKIVTVEVEKIVEVEVVVTAEPPASDTISEFNEAPMLADMVAAGDLPPVEERLPNNPRVLPVWDEIGEYGGSWRRAYTGITDRWGATKLQEERIVEFMPNKEGGYDIVPTWVDEFEMNDDASEFRFHIREGMKWSDGVAVTTEDVRFWYEDVFNTTLFREEPHQNLTTNGNPLEIEIIDDYTFIVKFTDSYPIFPFVMAKESTGAPGLTRDTFLLPAHYLKDFHPNYVAEDELSAIAAEHGVDTWIDLWGDKGPIQSWWLNPDKPVISAWKIETPAPAERVVMVRNPYYYAVDAEGNQLPYIDYITHDLFEDKETAVLWTVQGQIDMQNRHVGDDIANYTLYKEGEEKGDYRVDTWLNSSTNAFLPNLNTPDPVLAELFNTVDFRQALSLAINRAEINEIMAEGLAEPRQASPVSGSPQFDPEFETKWIEYDPDTANSILDELGLAERDSDGFRLRSDGEMLQVTITSRHDVDELELVKAYWEDVGIKVVLNIVERSLYEELVDNADTEIVYNTLDRPILAADPRGYLAIDAAWAPKWGSWFNTGGEQGEEPPTDHPIRQTWAAWEKAQTANSLEEANLALQELVTVHRENVWHIGTIGEAPAIFIVNNNMGNVGDSFLNDDGLRNPGIAQPAQFYFKQ